MNPSKLLVISFFSFCLFTAIAAGNEEANVSIGSYSPEYNQISIDNNGNETFKGTICIWGPGVIPISNDPIIEFKLGIAPHTSFFFEPVEKFEQNGGYVALINESGYQIDHRLF